MSYFMGDSGQQRGPFAVGELLGAGMRPDTLVWKESMPNWQRADSIPELRELLRLPAGPPPLQGGVPGGNPISASGGSSSPQRIPVAIVAILLGALGIHKFMLGLNKAGAIMLISSLVTFGAGLAIFSIVGLIEGIIYLSKSDQEFHQIYVVGKKEWF